MFIGVILWKSSQRNGGIILIKTVQGLVKLKEKIWGNFMQVNERRMVNSRFLALVLS